MPARDWPMLRDMQTVDNSDEQTPQHTVDGARPTQFPPPGWLTQEQAAARLGVKPKLLHKSTWRWRPVLAEHAVRMPKPTGWSCVVYPVELIGRIAGEGARETEARSPEGFVTRKEAIAMFNVSDVTWHKWTREG